jgi:hypothetical protein
MGRAAAAHAPKGVGQQLPLDVGQVGVRTGLQAWIGSSRSPRSWDNSGRLDARSGV